MHAMDLDILFGQLRELNKALHKMVKTVKQYDNTLETLNLRLCQAEADLIKLQANQRMNYKELDQRVQTIFNLQSRY